MSASIFRDIPHVLCTGFRNLNFQKGGKYPSCSPTLPVWVIMLGLSVSAWTVANFLSFFLLLFSRRNSSRSLGRYMLLFAFLTWTACSIILSLWGSVIIFPVSGSHACPRGLIGDMTVFLILVWLAALVCSVYAYFILTMLASEFKARRENVLLQ